MTNFLFIIFAFLALFLVRNVVYNKKAVASQHHDLYELHLSRLDEYAKELECEIDNRNFSVTDTKDGILIGVSKKKKLIIISYIDQLFHFHFREYEKCEFFFDTPENDRFYEKSYIKITLKEKEPIVLTTGFNRRRKKGFIGDMLVKNGQHVCSFISGSIGKKG